MVRIKDKIVSRYYATPGTYDVITYTEGGRYYAKDRMGNIICQDSPTACLQEAVNYVAQLGGGKILVEKGTYYPKKTIRIPDGINLVIDGEGNNTVFRYTDRFILFLHVPSNPTWTSTVILRNFKIDRRGSGENNTDIIGVSYAKYVMIDGIEIVDDWRDMDKDAGIASYSNLVMIVQNCRVFNKSYGIWASGFLSIARENYVVNTAKVGIAASGFAEGFGIPPGYSYGGLSIIENNVCIDCGRTDEGISVDYGMGSSRSYGVGIIRNNIIKTVNYASARMITTPNVEKVVIENNILEGTVNMGAIDLWSAGDPLLAIIRNNYINVTNVSSGAFVATTHKMFVFENNMMYATYNNISQNIFDLLHVYSAKVFIRGNRITTITPSNYGFNNIIYVFARSSDSDPEYVDIESNDFVINALSDNLVHVWFDFTYPTTIPQVIVSKNLVNAKRAVNRVLRLTIRGDFAYAFVRDNQVNSNVANKIGAWTDKSGIRVYIDADIPFEPYATMSYYYYKKNYGVAKFNGDGTTTTFTIAHNLVKAPSRVLVTPASKDAAGSFYVTTDDTYIYVNYTTAPPAGTNNVVLHWYAEV